MDLLRVSKAPEQHNPKLYSCLCCSPTVWTMWRLCTTSTAPISTPVEPGPSTPPVPSWRWDTGWRWEKQHTDLDTWKFQYYSCYCCLFNYIIPSSQWKQFLKQHLLLPTPPLSDKSTPNVRTSKTKCMFKKILCSHPTFKMAHAWKA